MLLVPIVIELSSWICLSWLGGHSRVAWDVNIKQLANKTLTCFVKHHTVYTAVPFVSYIRTWRSSHVAGREVITQDDETRVGIQRHDHNIHIRSQIATFRKESKMNVQAGSFYTIPKVSRRPCRFVNWSHDSSAKRKGLCLASHRSISEVGRVRLGQGIDGGR